MTDHEQLFAEIDAATRPLGKVLWLSTHWRQGGENWRLMKAEAIGWLNERIDWLTLLRDQLSEIGGHDG